MGLNSNAKLFIALGLSTTCILISICIYLLITQTNHLSEQIRAQNIEKSTKNKPESILFYPTLARTASVAAHINLRGQDLDETTVKYLNEVETDIVKDMNKAKFFISLDRFKATVNSISIVDNTNIKLYQEWHINFDTMDNPLRNKFPRLPYLAVDNEIITFPECEEESMPTLFWVKASRNGAQWAENPTILEDKDNKRWMIVFNQNQIIDPKSKDKRLLILAGCS